MVDLVKNNEAAVERWKSTDILIIDEISLLSSRVLEILNVVASACRKNDAVFGGIQIIVSGDFFQLPPVPNQWDAGKYAFVSPLWNSAFPHHFVLTSVVRQNEHQLIRLIQEVRVGVISEECAEYAKTLARPITETVATTAGFVPSLFAHNEDVDFHNFSRLQELPGDLVVIRAQDSGETANLDRYDLIHVNSRSYNLFTTYQC